MESGALIRQEQKLHCAYSYCTVTVSCRRCEMRGKSVDFLWRLKSNAAALARHAKLLALALTSLCLITSNPRWQTAILYVYYNDCNTLLTNPWYSHIVSKLCVHRWLMSGTYVEQSTNLFNECLGFQQSWIPVCHLQLRGVVSIHLRSLLSGTVSADFAGEINLHI